MIQAKQITSAVALDLVTYCYDADLDKWCQFRQALLIFASPSSSFVIYIMKM